MPRALVMRKVFFGEELLDEVSASSLLRPAGEQQVVEDPGGGERALLQAPRDGDAGLGAGLDTAVLVGDAADRLDHLDRAVHQLDMADCHLAVGIVLDLLCRFCRR